MSGQGARERDNWTGEGVESSYRYLCRLYDAVQSFTADPPSGDGGGATEYIERQMEYVTVIANQDFEELSFNTALREIQELLSLVDRYDTYTDPAPETIDIIVTPEWKFEAHSLARTFDSDNLVGEIMRRETFRNHDDASSFAKDLQAVRHSLTTQHQPEREATVLEQASWLIEQEFDATVTIQAGDEVDNQDAKHAEPGRPAIQITE